MNVLILRMRVDVKFVRSIKLLFTVKMTVLISVLIVTMKFMKTI